jgi:hypothetical protein
MFINIKKINITCVLATDAPRLKIKIIAMQAGRQWSANQAGVKPFSQRHTLGSKCQLNTSFTLHFKAVNITFHTWFEKTGTIHHLIQS